HRLLDGEPAPEMARVPVDSRRFQEAGKALPHQWAEGIGGSTTIGRRARPFVNREEQLRSLRAGLAGGGGPIVFVPGAQGVGKTALVDEALAELDRYRPANAASLVCRYSAVPTTRLTMKRLIEDVERGAAPTNRFVYGKESLLRLEAALDAYTGPPIVVVVDSAEHLLDDDRTVREADLDHAFDLLTGRARCPVTVVLLAWAPLRASAGTRWC